MADNAGPSGTKGGTPAPSRKDTTGRDVGSALRSVYQKTVEEKIPDEFLDLLGKLG